MFDAGEFLDELRGALRENIPQKAVREALARAAARPYDELERAFGPAERAELKTLYRSPELTVLKIVWAPGMSIDPHDHRMWAVIGIYGGVEDSQYFRRRPPGLERVAAKTLARGEVATLGHDVIHAVKNPRSTPTAAIHVYGGDFFATPRSEWDPETQEERPSSGERSRELFLRFGGVVITEVE
ncbi:MAG: hypothetical protein E6J78_18240 [Deltaproteobacteria bacterium]|nr:MAG: hypothetical protein E6J78_18240 [Deltaproteobacteria bacterium]